MLRLQDHTATALLYEDDTTRIYRGVDRRDQRPVMLKTSRSAAPERSILQRLRHEFAVLSDIHNAHVPLPYALHEHEHSLVLVHEDIGGVPLADTLRGQPFAQADFYAIALPLVDALESVHRLRMVHRDVNPRNVVVNAATGRVQLIDFGLASRLAREHTPLLPPDRLQGALPYLSPEQTGRMNRAVDYRADFYSLGAVFYELLTGQPPFVARDALELVHCHLAREPRSPSALAPMVPRMLSEIVMKLLAKLAEDRYQSAAGLRADLLECQRQWLAAARIEPFALARADLSERFQLPQKLFGREAEVAMLLDAFGRVVDTGRAELVLVAGYSGVGKSALVAELHKPITARRGRFIEGKFDQYRGMPYAPFAQALQSLMQQVLSEPPAQIDLWRERITATLGEHARIIIDMAPQLRRLIVAPPPLQALPPEQARHRLHRTVQRFLALFSQPGQPLTLFLDDLQWIDADSLELLSRLCSQAAAGDLLVIGAYRDNEVDAGHPLVIFLDRLASGALGQGALGVRRLVLAPLSELHLRQIVAETLHDSGPGAAELAALIYRKTQGNPFFAYQFLEALHEAGLIHFDADRRGWGWDLPAIRARDFTDNVVDLMLDGMRRLPAATQAALGIGGFLGNHFELGTLALIGGGTAETTADVLWPAERLGLVLRHDGNVRFLHDRVQDAAYLLTAESDRAAMHARIGRLLLAQADAKPTDEQLLAIVTHLNAGAGELHDPAERRAAALLDRRAGERAEAATAYLAAARYYAAGIALLPAGAWESDYALSYALHRGRAQCAWLGGEVEGVVEHVDELLARARGDIDWAGAAQILVDLYMTQGNPVAACQIGLKSLRRFGMDIPERPTEAAVKAAYDEHLALLGERPVESLADLPPTQNPRIAAAMQVLASLDTASYFVDRRLWVLLVTKMVTLSQRHGHAEASSAGYSVFGFVLVAYFQDYRRGDRFSELAALAIERHGGERYGAKVMYHRGLASIWVRPLRDVLQLFGRGLQLSLDNGDRVSACISAHRVVVDSWMSGEALDELLPKAERMLAFAHQVKYQQGVDSIGLRRQQVLALRGLTQSLGDFDGEAFDSAALLSRRVPPRAPIVDVWLRLARLANLCIAGDDAAAHDEAQAVAPDFWRVDGLLGAFDFHYFDALALARLCDGVDTGQHELWMEQLLGHAAQLDIWAEVNPAGFLHSASLVRAEIARLRGQTVEAMRGYDIAVRSARANGFVQHEALANERAAHFYADQGIEVQAEACLVGAREAYRRWGADGKLRLLDARHPGLARASPRLPATAEVGTVLQLDALALARASQAISSLMERDDLLKKLMEVVIELAGAQSGALLLLEGDQLRHVASAAVQGDGIVTWLAGAAKLDARELPVSVLGYVHHSQETVLIDDARLAHRFDADPYFIAVRPRSVFCLPILRQGRLTGLLYLEHRSSSNIFTLSRLAVLEQLAAQAAISLESAALYASLADHRRLLEATVEQRTAELSSSRALMQTLLDSGSMMITLKGLDGRYLMANRTFAETVGHSSQSLVGLSGADVASADVAARWSEQDRSVLQLDRSLRFEFDLPRDGRSSAYQVDKFPVRDAEGRVYAIGSIAFDITELKRTQAALEAATRAKSDFLANTSHEIRTPMNAILGMAHLALRSGLTPRQHNYVEKVERSAQSLLRLINDILDFSKIEAGKLDMESVVFELGDVIDNVSSVLAQQAESKGLALQFSIGPGITTALVGDPLRLGQVLINLGNNAIKFTQQGRVQIAVEPVPQDERRGGSVMLRFCVSDTGEGISEAMRERLFRPFEQADTSTTRRHGGTGLGLAVSRHLVGRMGGTIEVDSTPGAGSRFHFTALFGVARAELVAPGAAAALMVPAASVVTASTEVPTSPAMPTAPATGARGDPQHEHLAALRGVRILLVEDNAINQELAMELLTGAAIEVTLAENGEEALAALVDGQFDAVLMDCQMPVMDGYSATVAIRRQPRWQSLPIIAMTANVMTGDRERAMASGMNDHIAKPINVAAMFATLARWVPPRVVA